MLQLDRENNYSMTPAILQAVFVNNDGTKLVRNSQFDAAVKSFTKVLKILKPLAALVEAYDNNESSQISNFTGGIATNTKLGLDLTSSLLVKF